MLLSHFLGSSEPLSCPRPQILYEQTYFPLGPSKPPVSGSQLDLLLINGFEGKTQQPRSSSVRIKSGDRLRVLSALIYGTGSRRRSATLGPALPNPLSSSSLPDTHAYSVLCCALPSTRYRLNKYLLTKQSFHPHNVSLFNSVSFLFKFATEKCMLPCSKKYMRFFPPLKGTHQTTRRGHTLDHSWENTDLSSSRDFD